MSRLCTHLRLLRLRRTGFRPRPRRASLLLHLWGIFLDIPVSRRRKYGRGYERWPSENEVIFSIGLIPRNSR